MPSLVRIRQVCIDDIIESSGIFPIFIILFFIDYLQSLSRKATKGTTTAGIENPPKFLFRNHI
jgi:hypothetical protein